MFGLFIRGFSSSSALGFRSSFPLGGSPMKKKAKLDPAITRAREEKRRRRLAKALRRMQSQPRILRPIKELEEEDEDHLPEEMSRPSPDAAESERRALLLKEWNRFYSSRHHKDMVNLQRILESRSTALNELKSLSVPLYVSALALDPQLTNSQWNGPPVTPPLGKDHLLDGKYSDITKEFQVHYDDMKAFMEQLVQRKRIRKKTDEEQEDD